MKISFQNFLPALILAIGLLFVARVPHAQEAPPKMTILLLKDKLAVARLDPDAAIPAWAFEKSNFSAITRTRQELSIVAAEEQVPQGVKSEAGWRILKVEGPLDFALVGILASITAPLARAGVSIFAISTYDTDYVMLKDDKIVTALAALRAAGHTVRTD